jgi:hypothetical protein
MIFVLGSSAGALVAILFGFINQYVPGADAGYYYGDIRSAIQFPLASLVVMFPVLVWVIRFLKRDIVANPEKRELKIRKWLMYLTLFAAGLTVLGDLVTLVYSFLQGDITLRFILKVATVFWVAGSVFYYFLKDLHNEAPGGRKSIQWITCVIVLASLVVGFWISGSPAAQRARNRDTQRVSHLQMLESQVVSYWQAKQKLPATLNDLADGTIGGSVPPPTDPKTGLSYVYTITGERAYRLCATFETTSTTNSQVREVPVYVSGYISAWQHGVGEQCFDGMIDPDRFPPIKR